MQLLFVFPCLSAQVVFENILSRRAVLTNLCYFRKLALDKAILSCVSLHAQPYFSPFFGRLVRGRKRSNTPMKRHLLLLVAALVVAFAQQTANAQVTITNYLSSGPDVNSPTAASGFAYNAINAMAGSNILGAAPGGAFGAGAAAAAFSPIATNSGVLPQSVISTWNGSAAAAVQSFNGNVTGTVPSGPEYGNNLYFGAKVVATPGSTFLLTDVSFAATSTDGNVLVGAITPQTYSQFYDNVVGVRASDGAILDSISDSTATPLSALYIINLGAAYDFGITNQADMNAALDYLRANPVSATGNFSLSTFSGPGGGPVSGSNPFDLDVIPEPASMVVLGLGLVGLIGYTYRRRQAVSPVAC